jgi:hypothetical protein
MLMAAGEIAMRRKDDVITVVSPDSAGTFSQVAGVLSLHGLDVLTARAHSDEQGMAASEFRIILPEDGIAWRTLKTDLGRALAHQLAIESRLVERAKTYRRRRRTQAQPPEPPNEAASAYHRTAAMARDNASLARTDAAFDAPKLVAMLAAKGPAEMSELLAKPDVNVTNAKDKFTMLSVVAKTDEAPAVTAGSSAGNPTKGVALLVAPSAS